MSIIGLETAALTLGRFALFFACRKYLLRTLYSDLRSLSSTTTPGTPRGSHSPDNTTLFNTNSQSNINGGSLHDDGDYGNDNIEMLPPPTTHTPKSATKTFNSMIIEDTTYLHMGVSRIVFSWCFAESCVMFGLLMLQGLGIFSPSTRLINWHVSLFILMSAILVVIPLSISLLLAMGTSKSWSIRTFLGPRFILTLLPVGLYLYFFSYIPSPGSLESSDTVTTTLSRLIVLGTIILGLLSGFGAISNSWKFLPFISSNSSVPSERDIETAQYALTSVRNDIRERQTEAARRENVEGLSSSWFSRVGASFRGGDSLAQELQGLEALEYQMSRNLESLRERYQTAKFSATIKGKIFNFFGNLFMLYCVMRIISSIYNIVFLPSHRRSSSSYPDLIADVLSFVISKISSQPDMVKKEDIASFSRQLSLVLVGIIILSSIRMVLRGVTRALHITSRNLAASLMLLFLAQIMGIYMLSTLVQLRSSFPPLTSSDENLFSTIPAYEVFGALFDWSFLIAAAASLLVRWGAERVNGPGVMD